MTIHICRDFHSDFTQPNTNLYLAAIFLHSVLNYTIVGNTLFNLTGTHRVTTGASASINFGGTDNFAVKIPTASYVVSTADHGRLLALRSTLYPRHNSGIFRVLSSSVINNYLYIDYVAAPGSSPPVETNTLGFTLFLSESNFVPSASSAATGYGAFGSAQTSRIVMQSPHSSGWQVRICFESTTEKNTPNVGATMIPGFSGSSIGDFTTGTYDPRFPSEHLHQLMWKNSRTLANDVPGIGFNGSIDTTSRTRTYMWGDDSTGDFILVCRQVSSSYMDGWAGFGLASGTQFNSTVGLRTIHKLFAFGTQYTTTTKRIAWNFDPSFGADSGSFGVAFGEIGEPVTCFPSIYVYMGGQTSTTSPLIFDANASDSFILGSTELMPAELIAGTVNTLGTLNDNISTAYFKHNPRRMGLMPLARYGRANFGDFTLSTDANSSSIHLKNGVYLPWEGPPLRV